METTLTIPSFSPDNIERILSDTFIERVDYHSEIDSTNRRAMEIASESPAGDGPILVLTDRQTAGRGRGANRWWSGSGSLTFSVLLGPGAIQLPAHRWPLVSLVTGMAVCEGIESLFHDLSPQIKWPNDVYLSERKVCGILIETTGGRLVVGIGINVNNSASEAPPELRDKVIALCDLSTVQPRCIDVLVAVLQNLRAKLDLLSSGDASLREEWSKRCLLTGREIELDIHTQRLRGKFAGIDGDGALVLETETGLQRCHSGIVTRFA